MTTLICSHAQKLMFVYEKVHQLLGNFVPAEVPLQLDPHFSKGSAASVRTFSHFGAIST